MVTLQCKNNTTLKRPITKICPLPIEDNAHIAPEKKLSKKRRINPITTPLTLLCTLICLSYSLGSTDAYPISKPDIGISRDGSSINAPPLFNVSRLNNNIGLYHDHIGQVSLTNDNWKIITYFELDQMKLEEKKINEIIVALKSLCTDKVMSSSNNFCEITMLQIYHQKDLIASKNRLITLSYTHRTKRGLINAIGVVGKELFGTLDAQDGQHFNDEITKSRNNEEHLLSLLKNQTSIIELTKNILKKDDELMHQQFSQLHRQIITLQAKTGEASQQYLSILLYLTINMNGYQETQNAFLDMLTQLHDGKIPLSMLTPEQLAKQRLLIKKDLPHNLITPLETEGQSLLTTYSLM